MTRYRTEFLNQQTQPAAAHKVFNNWQVVTQGWYIWGPSDSLQRNQVKTHDIALQKICVFRDSKGDVHAMDGFCPHMGVDLGIGKVVNDRVRCFFHHWEFDAEGQCQHIPIQKDIPKKACLTAYACKEKYGYIWVHPDKNTTTEILEIPGMEGVELTVSPGKAYTRGCHHHITMINGIDPQHLRTVHDIHIDMDVNIEQAEPRLVEITLTGKMPDTTFKERLGKKILGESYSYAMKYADGCLAALTLLKDVRFLGRENLLPELYMFFAYQMVAPGETRVQPIFVTRKRKGIFGALISQICLAMTRLSFRTLQGEDGQVYENIRFTTQNLLRVDAPVARYIRYINQLEPSAWSLTEQQLKMVSD